MSEGGIDVARFWAWALWALVACVYGYLVVHVAGHEGVDFEHVHWGPHATLDGISPYPTSSNPDLYFESGRPYFIFLPGAPILLSPLGLLSRHAAWVAYSVPMVLLAPAALALIGRRLRPALPWLPPLLMLAVALFLPYQSGLKLGNLDLLCAGVVLTGLALLIRPSRTWEEVLGAVLIGAVLAVKPTLWPVALVVLVAIPTRARIGLVAGAVVPTVLGLLLVPDVDRFFTYVLPELSRGEATVENAAREALGDLARTTAVSHTAITVVSLLLTAAATIALIVVCARARARDGRGRWRFAAIGPVVPLALFLAPYGFLPYSIYLLVALPFLLVGRQTWMALAAGAGAFLIGADVTLRESGGIDELLRWRFLIGLAVIAVVALAGLREALRGRPALGLEADGRSA